jgi:cytoskeletal protein CcmA (bactofilin family)
MLKKVFLTLLVLALTVPAFALSATFKTETNIPKNEIVSDNLYLTGSSLLIDGDIEGDLTAAGGTINLTGTVAQDVLLAGGNLNIMGPIGGDVRVFGGNIVIDSQVKGEVLIFGGDVQIGPNVQIGGDLIVHGGRVVVDPQAKIKGEQKISQSEESNEKPASVFEKFTSPRFYIHEALFMLALLLAGVLFFAFLKRPMQIMVDQTFQKGNFWKNFGLGSLILFIIPVLIILSFISVIGILFGFLLFFGYIALILASMVYGGILFGGFLLKVFKRSKKVLISWPWVIFGIILLHILNLLPMFGWLIGFVFFMVAIGSAMRMKFYYIKKI